MLLILGYASSVSDRRLDCPPSIEDPVGRINFLPFPPILCVAHLSKVSLSQHGEQPQLVPAELPGATGEKLGYLGVVNL